MQNPLQRVNGSSKLLLKLFQLLTPRKPPAAAVRDVSMRSLPLNNPLRVLVPASRNKDIQLYTVFEWSSLVSSLEHRKRTSERFGGFRGTLGWLVLWVRGL